MQVTVYTVKTGERVRMETLNKDEAVRHAQGIYKSEGVIADIEETTREVK